MIKKSVGKEKTNKPVDVIIMQLLLNEIPIYKTVSPTSEKNYTLEKIDNVPPLAKMKISGDIVNDLNERIEAYQIASGMSVVDGWISPSGSTIRSILNHPKTVIKNDRLKFVRSKIANKKTSSITVQKIISYYQKQYAVLSSDNKDGLEYILTTAKADTDLDNIKELAYMLATTKHETAHTFRGIEEYGKGAGHTYGEEITVTDPTTKKTYKNKYYGRGYVQLTWGYNYQRLDEKIGNGSYPNKTKTKPADFNTGFKISNAIASIYLHPEKALEKENAYVGLVWGMQKGIYTGKKIGDYINAVTADYKSARKVINGVDQAQTIANYAEDFEIILLASAA
ncbi:glycoside hydrolase family 19 protein [Marinomonas gallaica]|uniref:glycoside hydrolase family 19 protein n=1 Tax=Marinomonas gallaica TaxID=1806667 RepID=UPI000834CCD1|nr:glycoside hydrolase family 19 protein [Marinomonas gallaica]